MTVLNFGCTPRSHSYDFEVITDKSSLTVPCRAMSVREILQRYQATGVIEGAGSPVYGQAAPQSVDMIDRYNADKAAAIAAAEAAQVAAEKKAAADKAAADKAFSDAVEAEVKKRLNASA